MNVTENVVYDAIVIGSKTSGEWAEKTLCHLQVPYKYDAVHSYIKGDKAWAE